MTGVSVEPPTFGQGLCLTLISFLTLAGKYDASISISPLFPIDVTW